MSIGIGRGKQGNGYYHAAGRDLFERCPKAVWAAIAISALTVGGDHLDKARERVIQEWEALHANGIVPQAPPVGWVASNEGAS